MGDVQIRWHISWNEVWTGTTVVRDVKREIDRIVDIKPVAPFTSERKMSQVTLIWTKVL